MTVKKQDTENQAKALMMLNEVKSISERADSYFKTIKEGIHAKMIQPLEQKLTEIEDKIFDLSDFALDTNLNKGLVRATREQCEKKFQDIIELEFNKTMLELELKIKKEQFQKLFI